MDVAQCARHGRKVISIMQENCCSVSISYPVMDL
jgi:hypothetical protein